MENPGEEKRMEGRRSLEHLPDDCLVSIIEYFGRQLEGLLAATEVCRAWNRRLHCDDKALWKLLAQLFRVDMPISQSTLQLRNTHNFKQIFIKAAVQRRVKLREKHDLLVTTARNLLCCPRDSSKKLKTLITSFFPHLDEFDVNWKCATLENNCLLTVCARYLHLRCMRMLLDQFGASVDNADVGGFNALILCAFHGFEEGVKLCIKKNADFRLSGALRSGPNLTAEHWAALQGHMAIFSFLREVRLKSEQKKQSQRFATVGPASPSLVSSESNLSATFPPASAPVAGAPDPKPLVQDERTYCICGRGFDGDMIACDNSLCEVEWFHYNCVGLEMAPEGAWFCPHCRGETFSEPLRSKKRIHGGKLLAQLSPKSAKRRKYQASANNTAQEVGAATQPLPTEDVLHTES